MPPRLFVQSAEQSHHQCVLNRTVSLKNEKNVNFCLTNVVVSLIMNIVFGSFLPHFRKGAVDSDVSEKSVLRDTSSGSTYGVVP